MFCPHCGILCDEDAVFCRKCGNKLEIQTYDNLASAQEPETLEKLTAHFSQKAKQYEDYDKVCQQIPYYGPGASKTAFVWAFLIAGITSLIMLGCCIAGEFGGAAATFGLSNIPCFFLVGGGLLVHRKNRINYRTCCQQYLELGAELANHYQLFPQCPVPPEYTNPRALAAIKQQLESGQAASIAESTGQILSDFNRNVIEKELASLRKYTEHLPQPRPVFLPGKYFSAKPNNKKDAFKYYLT